MMSITGTILYYEGKYSISNDIRLLRFDTMSDNLPGGDISYNGLPRFPHMLGLLVVKEQL